MEGRLAVAENSGAEMLQAHSASQHPNGAVALVESNPCVTDVDIETYVERYQRYQGYVARQEGAAYLFDLRESSVGAAIIFRQAQ